MVFLLSLIYSTPTAISQQFSRKMRWSVSFLGIFIILQTVAGKYEKLRGRQIWKLGSKHSEIPVKLMYEGFVDILSHSEHSLDVLVDQVNAEYIRDILSKKQIPYEILVDDMVEHLKDNDRREQLARNSSKIQETCTETHCPVPLTKSYMNFNQIEWYLKEINGTHYPLVNLSTIGTSHEDRDIWLLHIKSDNKSAKSIWIEGGIHAREWISPAVCLGLIARLVNDADLKEDFDFFIAPMANPDGYAFSFDRAGDRLWRKNRRKNADKRGCHGVDLNRNWDFHFGVGSTDDPCHLVYKGPSPFSEPETTALKNAMLNERENLVMVLAVHSYGQVMLYPWGWTYIEDAPKKDELIRIGKVFAEGAAESTGTVYTVENAAGGLYVASGATDDWALGVLGAKYVYTLELRDQGKGGFVLSSDAIQPSIEEVHAGLQKALSQIVI